MTTRTRIPLPISSEPLIDTHTHLYVEEFDKDFSSVLARAREAGVRYFLLPNLNISSLPSMLQLCKSYPRECYPMIGLHPSYVSKDYRENLDLLRKELEKNPQDYQAVGEIGLDYYWTREFQEEMNDALKIQLHWAAEYDLPVSLHARDAVKDVVRCIRSVGSNSLRGVFHSFTGNEEELLEILQLPHFCVGVNGVLTFKNSSLPDLFRRHLPIDRVVVETDAPYLAPAPYRGKRNEPSYLPYVMLKLSEIYDLPYKETAQVIFANSTKMFNLATSVSVE